MPDRRNIKHRQGDKPVLIIMARWPQYGVGKTRLAETSNKMVAVSFQRHALSGLLRKLTGPDTPWTTRLALTPRHAWRSAQRRLQHHPIAIVDQGRGDLGQRMHTLICDAPTHQPVILIGSDTPSITRADIQAAIRALRGHDMVLGPTHDGGYWLIGWRQRPCLGSPRLCPILSPVRWSSEFARQDTIECLKRQHRCAFLRFKTDVDDAGSLRQSRLLRPLIKHPQ